MSNQSTQRGARWSVVAIIGALVVAILVVTVVGLLTAGATPPATAPTSSSAAAAAASVSASSTATSPSVPPTVSSTPAVTSTPPAAVSTPQPTKTTPISKSTPAAITKALTVSVVKMEAVIGTASGPGEIAGPSVRFTIKITNTTGAAVPLSSTVVNAYSGAAATPAVQLRSPGGRDLPASVADGGSVTGVFIFNIPVADRSHVKVTVDTSVQNPVIAFQGAAPRS